MKSMVLIDVEKQPEFVTDHYYITSQTEPLGLLYLESFLSAHGVSVSVLKTPLTIIDWVEIKKADIVGLSALTYCWSEMKRLAKRIRKENPRALIVAGREHASLAPESVLNNDDNFDAVVMGEGEYSLLALAQGKDFKEIPGFVYKDVTGNILHNSSRLLCSPRDFYPLKRRREWMINMLQESILQFKQMAGVMMSRGCQFKCEFCTAEKMWGGYKSIGYRHALNEVLSVTEMHDIRYFAFHDLMLNTSSRVVYEFCEEILKRKVEANFFAMMSVTAENLDFKYLRKAGFSEIGVGIEIPSDRRKEIGKVLSFEKTMNFVRKISDAGIFVRGYLILGWPWETSKEDLVDEYSSALKLLPINAIRMHFLTPFPGTGIFNKYKDCCIYQPIENGYNHFTTMGPVLRFKLQPFELVEARKEILKNYYSSKEYMSLIRTQRKSQTLKQMNEAFYENSIRHIEENKVIQAELINA